MREIKFRAWDNLDRKMSKTIPLIELIGEMPERLFGNHPWSHLIWMQYTGLHDKNGKEIYEGDFIREQYYTKKKDTGETRSMELIDEVRWGKYQDDEYDWTTMCWLLGNNPLPTEIPTYNNPYWVCLDFKWEVIGDIYSNPELLEEK